MKKILLIAMVAIITVMSASCGFGGGSSEKTIEIVSVDEVKLDDYKNTFDDLVNYFKKIGYILCKENGDAAATETKLNADVINAKQGKRFQFTYSGSQVTIELYEFYTGKDATPSDAIKQVKENGKFSVLGLEEFDAYLSNNEKYMMIYTDKEDDKKNVERKESAIELFKNFDR